MNSTKLRHSVTAANIAASVGRIALLDSIWTQYLAEAEAVPSSDVEVLAEAVAEINRLLSELLYGLPLMLTSVANGPAMDLRRLIRDAGIRHKTDPSKVQHILKECDKFGGDQHAASKLSTQLRGDIPGAREELDKKIDHLRAGGFTPGDLPKVGCALGYTLFMIGHHIGSQAIEDAGWNMMVNYC